MTICQFQHPILSRAWPLVSLPASINDGTVSDVLQGLQQFALGFVSSVGAWRTAGVGDRDLDATSAIHRGVFVQFTQNGGGADQEVPQCGTHGPGQVWELVCQFSKGLQHEFVHSPKFDLNIYFNFRTCSYCISAMLASIFESHKMNL